MSLQRIFSHFLSRKTSKASTRRGRVSSEAGRQGKKSRGLRLESLQKRELLASDLASISGVAFIDSDGDNTVDVGETLLQNVDVELYLDDVVQNGVFDAGETLVGTMTTGADGAYLFENLDGEDTVANDDAAEDLVSTPAFVTTDGFYVLRFAENGAGLQDELGNPLAGVVLSDDVGVQITDDNGVTAQTIDDFQIEQPSQPVIEDTAGQTETSSSGALTSGGAVIGDERDVAVELVSGTGESNFQVNATTGELVYSNDGDVRGTLLLQYDGSDADGAGLVLNATGLGGVNLSDSDAEAGITIAVRSGDAITNGLEIRVFTDAANFSTTQVDLPDNLADGTPLEIFVPFSDFGVGGGAGATFTNVGAIEAFVDSSATPGLDLFVAVVESTKSTEFATVSPATVPLFLGGEVFVDNGGGTVQAEQDNGLQDGGEPVFLATAGNEIVVQLFDTDPSGGGETPIATTTVEIAGGASPGSYEFSTVGGNPLGPGTYFVVIPESEFDASEPLEGFRGSSVDTPAGDTDDDADDDNDGVFVTGVGFISGEVTLTIGGEPTTANSNLTVDFGVLPTVDLRVDKTLNVGASTLEPGGTAVFSVNVSNLGPTDATDIVVSDFLPTGLTIDSVTDSGAATLTLTTTTVSGQTVESFDVPDLAAGSNAIFTVTASIDGAISADPTNEVRVEGFQVEVDNDPTAADRGAGDPLDGALENNTAIELVDIPLAELTVTKTDSLTTTSAGTQITYTIEVTNTSTDVASNVVALDTLPTGATFVSGAFTDGAGTVALLTTGVDAGKVQADLGDLAAGEDETFTIVVSIDPDLADGDSPLSNSVTATADNAADVTASDDTAVTRLTDVTVAKAVVSTRTPDDRTDADDTDDIVDAVAPFSVFAGGFVTYEITATNAGPSVARGVQVIDTLDASLTLVSGSFDAGTSGASLVAPTDQTLTFNVPDLAVGESRTFTFEVQVASSEFSQIDNLVTISTTDPESDAGNNTGTVSIDPDPRVDLVLGKSVAPTTAVPGQDQVVYTFTISHDVDSLSDALNVDVTDQLPAGLTGVTIDGTGITSQDFNTTTRQILVEYASIPVGETRTFTVTADVDADATGPIVNSAAVAVPGVTELDTTNNSDTASITLTPEFDLVVAKTLNGNTSVGPLDSVTFTIVVSHDTDDDGTEADDGLSPSLATSVVLTDVLPTGLTFTSATAAGAAVTPTSTTNGTIVFPSFDLAPGSTRTYTITASVDDDANGLLTNNTSFVTATGETDTTNNSSSADVTVVPQSNVRVSKIVDNATARTGTELVYTVTVNNDGPSPAEAVTAVDTLPSGVTFVSGTGPNGALTATNGVVTVNGGTLASAGSFQFTITARINDGVTVDQVNTVSVTTTTAETNSTDNTATVSTAVDQAINELTGTIFRDFDNDGILDGMDSPLEGIELLLTGGDLDAAGRRAVTDANGMYTFDELIAGTYNVQRLDEPEYFLDGLEKAGPSATPADAANQTIEVIVGGTAETVSPENDFALVPFLSYKLCIL